MIQVRPTSKHDTHLISAWWRQRMDIRFNPDLLSETGYMAFNDAGDIAALYLYPIMGSKVCWIGWPISDPDSRKETRSEALDKVFNACHKKAEDMGYKLIWTTSGTPPVEKRLNALGYIKGDENINQYWKGLD